jgi:hypothetical protein
MGSNWYVFVIRQRLYLVRSGSLVMVSCYPEYNHMQKICHTYSFDSSESFESFESFESSADDGGA